MGIRIHKVMGYGLTDVTTEGTPWWPSDSRINQAYREDPDLQYDRAEEFLSWVTTCPKEDFQALGDDPLLSGLAWHPLSPHKTAVQFLVNYNPEFGEADTFVLVPFSHPKWARRDDDIDYAEHLALHGEPSNTVIEVEGGFYPYSGQKVLKPGRDNRIPESEQELVYGGREKLAMQDYRLLYGRGGEELRKHLEDDWMTRIPEDIIVFARWMELFTDPEEVYNLKPIVYTWWT